MALRNRRIKVGLLLGGVLVLVAGGAVGALVRPVQEPDTVVEARFGDVKWNHELHARLKDIASCQVCHHKERLGTTNPKPCRECHEPQSNAEALVLADLHAPVATPKYEGDKGPPPMTAFHGRCVGCHEAMKKGPVVCRDCHAQKFAGSHGVVEWDHMAHARRMDLQEGGDAKTQCVRCHHKDTEAKTDADYRPCSACHAPAATKDLDVKTGIARHEKTRHGDCKRCHTVFNPEQGRRTCKDCHKGWAVDTKKQRPTIEQAVHQRCMECHNDDYPEVTEGMPVRCEDCHRPDPSVLADLEVGLILWDHDRHAEYGDGMRCDRCHHTDRPDQPHMACDRCHGTGLYDNPPVAEALRKRCLGCHQEKDNGLVSWSQLDTERADVSLFKYEGPDGVFWWNHREHATGWSFSCRNCHHGVLRKDGAFVTAAKVDGERRGEVAQIQSCRACHGGGGPVAGSPAEGTEAPALEPVFQKVCLECHRRLGGGPQEWRDFFEKEPVEPAGGEERE